MFSSWMYYFERTVGSKQKYFQYQEREERKGDTCLRKVHFSIRSWYCWLLLRSLHDLMILNSQKSQSFGSQGHAGFQYQRYKSL